MTANHARLAAGRRRGTTLAQSRNTLLVVDDDLDIRDALQDVLQEAGYRVQLASDGQEALDTLRGGCCPDLIVLDLMMPRMNGFEFRDVQRHEAPLSAIPVLLASADPALPQAARSLGVAGYLRKPLDLDDLLGAVDRLCCARAAQASAERAAPPPGGGARAAGTPLSRSSLMG
jgi:two-component system, chemotaxis family, chemotaxis protein CheY